MLKSCFNAHTLSSLELCATVSAEYHLGLPDSVVRNAERLCEGGLCCLGHRRSPSAAVCLWNLLPSHVFSGGTLSSLLTCAYRGISLIFYLSLFRSLFAVL